MPCCQAAHKFPVVSEGMTKELTALPPPFTMKPQGGCSTKVEVLGTDWSATLTTAKFVRIFAPLSLVIAAWCAASGLDDHLKTGF